MSESDSNDAEFQKQMELQRLAFEKQFGSLEEMGFEDETKKEENEEASSSDNESESNSEVEDYKLGNIENSDEELSSENEEPFDSDMEMDLKEQENIIEEKQPKRQPKVISFGDSIKDEVDTFSRVKLTDKIIKKMQNKQKPNVTNSSKKNNSKKNNEDEEDDDEIERKNLQNDIELQNFIRDSHLLNSFGGSESNMSNDVVGKARMKVMESQMKNLVNQNKHISNKNKTRIVDKIEKVPVNIRKGMIQKHMKRINKFEEDAKDNGIVLAKQSKGSFRKIDFTYKKDIERRIGKGIKSKISNTPVMRDKGLRINAIGRSTRNGLIISKNDINKINGEINKSRNRKGGKSKRK